MKSSRLIDWMFGAKQAVAKDPSVETKLIELDKLVTETCSAIGCLPNEARTPTVMRALEVIENYGEVTRELITASAWGNAAIPILPFHKRALLHHAKLMQALVTPKKEI